MPTWDLFMVANLLVWTWYILIKRTQSTMHSNCIKSF